MIPLSRSVRWARTVPASAAARTPKWRAVAEYQTSTSVAWDAGRPSAGLYWVKWSSRAAWLQTDSVRAPSTETLASSRGGETCAAANWKKRSMGWISVIRQQGIGNGELGIREAAVGLAWEVSGRSPVDIAV